MHRLLLFLLLLSTTFSAVAQMPDMLSVRRKNGRTIKTFYAGSTISFITKYGTPISGSIVTMRNDSIYIHTYNIRAVPTTLGVTMVDTFARRIERVHYQDIGRIEVYSRKRGFYGRLAGYAAIGGGGYIFLNVFNGLMNREPVTAKENLKLLIAPAATAIGGIAARQLLKGIYFTKKRHRIVYISLN
ncbi:hypothetical protein [Paracnuella aquatica]|uniref:hypothetical protein n=1 Tax=Paracnuella aquatica TaxID=2268757 RepID=UPI000F4E3435|nr:hypothetical protein [Paracnuella aquatica]RPD51648.1 hypothetical protein DRJ53_02915 [Paracnuella aquatica]